MPETPQKLLVVIPGPAGRRLGVRETPDGRHVVSDISEERDLGDLNGDLMPFLVTMEGTRYLICAGVVLGPGADRVELSSRGPTGMHQTCLVHDGVWMSFPEPFVEGMTLAAVWRRRGEVLFEAASPPLYSDALEPVFGPGWTSYAPL